MSDLSLRGSLSVEEMNALFDERLRVSLPGGSFKVIQHSYSNESSMVYDRQLTYSMTISLQPEGHIFPLNEVPALAASDDLTSLGKGNCTN